ncbi:unnamed protein product [Rotaria socialis]|uniref:Uncharacterized protein n=1 Tax=Rotaria socialis TaxID=392032 RepID=A0A818JZV7_9BILA|nr:unnamed protein product [Rotaria socialis]CAF4365868.1 unnamed protein product [Rotaria socialis]
MDQYSSRTEIIRACAFKQSSDKQQNQYISNGSLHELDSSLDQEYQALFKNKGQRKAKDVLQYIDDEYRLWKSCSALQFNNNEDCMSLRSSTAVISIGGADGSELLAILQNLGSCHGILVEISPPACAEARANGIQHVIESDAMDAAQKVVPMLLEWQEKGHVSSVLFSCQSVLHELSTRSPKFTREEFLKVYLEPLIASGLRTMFYAREPCTPRNWSQETDLVAIRLFKLDKTDIEYVANEIANKLSIQRLNKSGTILTDRELNCTVETADNVELSGRAVLPLALGQELLFKLIYWKDLAHFEYEMGEQLTSFEPESWSQSLAKIGMNSRMSYLTTEHFRRLYRQEESLIGEPISINAYNGKPLTVPMCFAQIFSSNVKTHHNGVKLAE